MINTSLSKILGRPLQIQRGPSIRPKSGWRRSTKQRTQHYHNPSQTRTRGNLSTAIWHRPCLAPPVQVVVTVEVSSNRYTLCGTHCARILATTRVSRVGSLGSASDTQKVGWQLSSNHLIPKSSLLSGKRHPLTTINIQLATTTKTTTTQAQATDKERLGQLYMTLLFTRTRSGYNLLILSAMS